MRISLPSLQYCTPEHVGGVYMHQVREVLAQIVATGVQHGSTATIAIWTTLPTCEMRTITSAAQEIRKYRRTFLGKIQYVTYILHSIEVQSIYVCSQLLYSLPIIQ